VYVDRTASLDWGILKCNQGGTINHAEIKFGHGVSLGESGIITNSKFIGQRE